MPISVSMRERILQWIKDEKPYSEIIELVEQAGGKISRGGITYIKKTHLTEQTKQTEQKSVKKTGKTKPKISPESREEIYKEQKYADFYKALDTSPASNTWGAFLTDLEFKMLENSFQTLYKSNLIRLQNNRAHGILNALNSVDDIIKKIKIRGNFQ